MQLSNQEQFITIIIAIIIVLLFLGVLFIIMLIYYRNKKNNLNKEILATKIETQEETMSILGKELHDNVGQLLSSTKMLIGITERNLQNPPETLLIANDTLAKAIYELRSLSKSLNKEWLEQFNFIENLSTEKDRINASKTIQIHFNHPQSIPLPADKQIILFRVVQEALQNGIKHSKANNIEITVETTVQALSISIKDDGIGFDVLNSSNGLGLLNIKQRVHLLEGTVYWISNQTGTTLNIQLPIKEK